MRPVSRQNSQTLWEAGVPGILLEMTNYTWGIIWHMYDTPNYNPLVCRNFKFDTSKH